MLVPGRLLADRALKGVAGDMRLLLLAVVIDVVADTVESDGEGDDPGAKGLLDPNAVG